MGKPEEAGKASILVSLFIRLQVEILYEEHGIVKDWDLGEFV
jgi:hypothetical protein